AVRAMKADKLEDLIALVALYRPGPMAQIPTYCARKLGKEKVEYLHPVLEPILKETFGVITYQEQVQQAARDMAGYTLAQADLLRRAMGKKIKREMDDQRAVFMKGAAANGIDKDIAKATFDACAKFAEYGFNKSHSAPYAYISYQTAYLKAHYPVEFLAASMTLDMGNTDKLMLFKREAERMGIKVLPPSVNAGGVDFAVKDGAIIYSMAALKNVGAGAIAEMIATRSEGGAFKTLGDFARRVPPHALNRRALESLFKAGAFDALNANRAVVLETVDSIIGIAGRNASVAAAGQNDMFGSVSGGSAEEIVLPRRDAWLPMEKLGHEFDAVGFYLSGHPLDEYAKALNRLGVESYASFREKALTKGATAARLAGTVTMKQERRSKQGNKFAFVGFSDPSGQFETVVFSDQLAAARELLEPGRAVVLRVEADVEGEEVKLRLQSVEALDKAAATITQGIQIFMRDASAIAGIAKRLQTGGRSPARVTLMLEAGREVEIGLGSKFSINPQIKGAVRAMDGVVDVQDL
ncbi:MAG TPA: DNA polymerase III subunit alpha, partial [Aestuariivirga sp.]